MDRTTASQSLVAAKCDSCRSARTTVLALKQSSQRWAPMILADVRYKTLQVARKRLQTALNRLTPKSGDAIDPELAAALEQAGF